MYIYALIFFATDFLQNQILLQNFDIIVFDK